MSWPNREKEKKKYVYVQLLTAKILLGAERRGGLGTLYIGMTEAKEILTPVNFGFRELTHNNIALIDLTELTMLE